MKNILILASILVATSCAKQEINPTPESEESTVPTELLSQYTLESTHNIGVPMSNPTGVASDGTNLWIMSGEHNGDQHELILYDPLNYTILKQFTYTNLIEASGTGVYGITWDGESVWISVSGNVNKVVKVDPNTGDILHTWSSPTTLGPSDLEWGRDKMWVSSGTGQIYSMDTGSGGSQHILSNVGNSSRDLGIAFRNDELWIGNLFNNNVLIYNALDGTYLGMIKNALIRKGKFCFHNGQLAVISSSGIAFYDVIG